MTHRADLLRERIAAATTLLQNLWGDGLPPGPAPWQRIVADVIDVDDSLGEQQGLTVQGDELTLAVLAEALSYVPAGASLHATVPQSLTDRMRQAAAVRDPDARGLAIGARLLSVAIHGSGARWAGIYRHVGDTGDLAVSLGMTPWERTERSRIALGRSGALCKALEFSLLTRGLMEVPVAGTGWGGEPQLTDAPSVAAPFPSTKPGQPAAGGLMLVWPTGADPDPRQVGALLAPLVAEAEHLLAVELAPRTTAAATTVRTV